jgi:hypothetical protein
MSCEDLEDLNVRPSMASKFLDRISLMVELRRRAPESKLFEIHRKR